MSALQNNQSQLHVDRERLLNAVKMLSASPASRVKWVNLSFDKGLLRIASGASIEAVPAEGTWPETIFVDGAWVTKMRTLLPEGNRISLRVENDRFYTNNFWQTCRLTVPEISTPGPEALQKDREDRIAKAAKLLAPLHVRPEDLQTLVNSAENRGTPIWQREEAK